MGTQGLSHFRTRNASAMLGVSRLFSMARRPRFIVLVQSNEFAADSNAFFHGEAKTARQGQASQDSRPIARPTCN